MSAAFAVQIPWTNLVTVTRSVPSESLALLRSSTLPSANCITLRVTEEEDPKEEKGSERPPPGPPGL